MSSSLDYAIRVLEWKAAEIEQAMDECGRMEVRAQSSVGMEWPVERSRFDSVRRGLAILREVRSAAKTLPEPKGGCE